jgi:hypothetical protein
MRKILSLAAVLALAGITACSQAAVTQTSKVLTNVTTVVVAGSGETVESHNAGAVPAAKPENPKWINGNWYGKAAFGAPGDTNIAEVIAQQAAYQAAKAKTDVQGMFENALWSSVQGWVLNNAGHRILQSITEPVSSADTKAKAAQAKTALQQAIDTVQDAPALDNLPAAVAQHETDERAAVLEKATSNLTYAKQILGELPWPKAASSDPDADAK